MTLLEHLQELTARIGNVGNVGVTVTVDPRPITLPDFSVRANILYTNGVVDETCAGPDVASVLKQVDDKLTAQGL
jgi:hypothetical protein